MKKLGMTFDREFVSDGVQLVDAPVGQPILAAAGFQPAK